MAQSDVWTPKGQWPCGHPKMRANSVKLNSTIRGCRICQRERDVRCNRRRSDRRVMEAVDAMEFWDG